MSIIKGTNLINGEFTLLGAATINGGTPPTISGGTGTSTFLPYYSDTTVLATSSLKWTGNKLSVESAATGTSALCLGSVSKVAGLGYNADGNVSLYAENTSAAREVLRAYSSGTNSTIKLEVAAQQYYIDLNASLATGTNAAQLRLQQGRTVTAGSPGWSVIGNNVGNTFTNTSSFAYGTTIGSITVNPTATLSAGTIYRMLNIDYTINATAASTGGTCTGIYVNATETSLGSGGNLTHRLMNLNVGGTSKFKVDNDGTATIASGKAVLETTNTPASASATGVKGTICWDATYLYVCVDTDTWKRSLIETW